jgi:hypothetical protein
MKTKKLIDYMKQRAAHEGVKWELTEAFLQAHFDRGVRNFFGVAVDNRGQLIRDTQQPDFFETYRHNTGN